METKEKTYWTTKDGRKIDVDEMDLSHLKNVLKYLINNGMIITDNDDYMGTEADIY
jgi:hypothetical protein